MTDEVFDKPLSLMATVQGLLKPKRDRDLVTIMRETKIPYFWLRKFAAGEFKNPSVNRVQFLYEHLTNTKLDVSEHTR